MKWGMVIDLTKCISCYACVTALLTTTTILFIIPAGEKLPYY